MFGFDRGRIVSYNAEKRTANVQIYGKTDGVPGGLEATFAYAVGEDDRDTELKILNNTDASPDVFVFYEGGDESMPVIAFFSSHGASNIQDVRRIRQKNIELLADNDIKIQSQTLKIYANVEIYGDVTHENGTIKTPKLVINEIDVGPHNHTGDSGGETGPMK